MKITPVGHRIAVVRDRKEEVTAGGIHIPETTQDLPITGMVTALGTVELTESGNVRPMPCQVGQRVAFGKYAGTVLKLEGQEVIILNVSDVLGILE